MLLMELLIKYKGLSEAKNQITIVKFFTSITQHFFYYICYSYCENMTIIFFLPYWGIWAHHKIIPVISFLKNASIKEIKNV